MSAWGTAIFSDDLADAVRSEYNALLSVGRNNDEAERLLFSYFSEYLEGNHEEEPVFWFALALAEWNKGRLSDYVKEKAMFILDNGGDLERWELAGDKKRYEKRKKVIEEFRNTLQSPLPEMKRVKTSYQRCPWKVGSLLAYRIVNNEKQLINSTYWRKYVLLRVIKVKKTPVSRIVPDEAYDESMLVGLYKWVGAEIPDPEIVSGLEFTPIFEGYIKPPKRMEELNALNQLPEKMGMEIRRNLLGKRVETCAMLDWGAVRGKKPDITLLSRDLSYEEHIPDFFNTSITSYGIFGTYAFDLWIEKRMRECFGDE